MGSSDTYATHIVGGELTYEYVANDIYRVYLTVYRDCFGGQAEYDNPAVVGVFNSNNEMVTTITMNLGTVTQVPSSINNPCITPPNNVCVEVTTYAAAVSLPPIPGGYQLAYQRCCRNGIIQNIQTPGDVGATYYARIPDPTVYGYNSSPNFNTTPPLYLCSSLQFIFDHAATDPDGDELVYELYTPLQGLTNTNPGGSGTAPDPPPYMPIQWQAPYSLADVMGGVPLTIHPQTGLLTVTPNTIGTFVVGVCVSEYRNGVLLNQTKRDFQFTVSNCDLQVVSSFFTPAIQCNNTVIFTNTSDGANSYTWDFGIDGTTNDTSTSYAPAYIYPGPGEYTVTLHVQDSISGCSDSSIFTFNLFNINVEATGDATICEGDGTPISASGGLTYSWTPTTGLSDPLIANPIASPTSNTSYIVTGTDSAGCSGVDTVDVLVVSNQIDVGEDQDICEGESIVLTASSSAGQITWSPANTLNNPNSPNPLASPTSTTTYHANLVTPLGCTAEDSITITVNPVPTVTAEHDTAICSGESTSLTASGADSYAWTPTLGLDNATIPNPAATPSSTTTYTVSGENQFGCEGTADVTVTVKPRPNANAGEDEIICDGDSIRLNASGGISYNWTPVATLSDPSVNDPWSTPLITTEYSVTVMGANGCDSTDQVTVNVISPPVADLSLPPEGCINDNVTITFTGTASPFALYTWNFDGGDITAGSGEGPYTVSWNTTGTQIVSVGVNEDICGIDQTQDTIVIHPVPPSEAGDEVSICSGDDAALGTASQTGLSYQWSPANGLDDPSASDPTLNLTIPAGQTQTTFYTVTTIDQNGCLSKDSVQVTVFPIPIADFDLPANQCFDNNSFSFNAGGVFGNAAQFAWGFGSNATPTNSNVQNPSNIAFNASGEHTISLIIIENGCESEPHIASTIVHPTPIADLQALPLEGCQPLVVVFEDRSESNGSTLSYAWKFGDNGTSSQQNPTHTYLGQGLFSVELEVTSAEGCKDDTLYEDYILVHPNPVSDFYARPEVAPILNPNIQFYDNSINANTISYYMDGEMISGNNDFQYTFPDTGYYVISQFASTTYGCSDSSDVTVYIQPLFTFYVPNAFTPNRDRDNAVFYCYGEGISKFELNIFTRWGESIYHSVDMKEGWDGTYKGEPATDDVYTWLVTLTTYNGEEKQFSGHVTLIR